MWQTGLDIEEEEDASISSSLYFTLLLYLFLQKKRNHKTKVVNVVVQEKAETFVGMRVFPEAHLNHKHKNQGWKQQWSFWKC